MAELPVQPHLPPVIQASTRLFGGERFFVCCIAGTLTASCLYPHLDGNGAESSAGGTLTSGGKSGSGGVSTAGGSNTAGKSSIGGTANAGGTGSLAGSSALGGNVSTGTSSVAGGSGATGGASSTGGKTSTSASASGGGLATGGATSAGNSGGGVATGGATSTGTSQATGGLFTTGGALPTGGTNSTGATQSAGGMVATGGGVATGGVGVIGGAANTGGSSGSATPLRPASDVSLGIWHSCALMQDRTVRCWGNDDYGQLGSGAASVTTTCFPATGISGTPQICVAPIAISSLSNVTALAAGGYHTCALISDGSVKCWGRNDRGQLGDGTTVSKAAPVTPIDSGAIAIATGRFHSCAVVTGNVVKCWGTNQNGQLGASGLPADCSTAYYSDFAETEPYCPTPFSVVGVSSASNVATGYGHTCALISNGSIKCWGDNSVGQLGQSVAVSPSAPVTVSGLSAVKQLASNDVRTCTVSGTGNRLQCWGQNQWGEVGNGNTIEQDTPVPVANLPASPTVLSVATGAGHTCSLMSDSTLRCWGDNAFGELATNDASPVTSPVTPGGVNGAVSAVSGGGGHTSAVITADQSIQCWGRNQRGQLGTGTTADSVSPVTVNGQ